MTISLLFFLTFPQTQEHVHTCVQPCSDICFFEINKSSLYYAAAASWNQSDLLVSSSPVNTHSQARRLTDVIQNPSKTRGGECDFVPNSSRRFLQVARCALSSQEIQSMSINNSNYRCSPNAVKLENYSILITQIQPSVQSSQ